jgi:hypothetical protein
VTYFLADDGFYSCNGQQIDPIGAEKVNRFFFQDIQESELAQMSAAVDPERNLVMWGYLSNEDIYRILVYHVVTKRWSVVNTTVNRVASSSTPSVTLEALDTYSASIDALDTSLDSRIWLGGKMTISGVRADKIITFSGSPKTGTIETADLQTDGQSTMITMAKPLVDNGSASIAVASRLLLSEQPTFGSQTAASSENRVGIRSYGKYHRLQVSPSGANWSTAIGVDIEIQPAGGR